MVMDCPSIHHVGIGTIDAAATLSLFQQQLGFEIICVRETFFDKKWVLRHGNITFVVTKPNMSINSAHNLSSNSEFQGPTNCLQDTNNSNRFPYLALPDFSSSWEFPDTKLAYQNRLSNLHRNSVYEVSLEVKDVQATLNRAQAFGATILRPLTVVKDANGEVTYATIRSCVGNVQHTILNTKNYRGEFLPGFDIHGNTSGNHVAQTVKYGCIDHVTLVVHPHQTADTIHWYENCLGMQRLPISKNEDPVEGLLLEEIGLRMTAMEYWRCSEAGLAFGSCSTSAKFVIGESPSSSPNQVSTFLRQHRGAGIQHIGILTDQLVDAVKYLKQAKVQFLQPPPEYYEEIEKLKEISTCGESVELLEECGILLDSEADYIKDANEEEDPINKYLMQVFTKPIFGDDAFFLEFLQRHGAQGFGAGNITALFRAVDLYLKRKGGL